MFFLLTKSLVHYGKPEFPRQQEKKAKKIKKNRKDLIADLECVVYSKITVWVISPNCCRQNILIFTAVNSKYDSKAQMTKAISKNI